MDTEVTKQWAKTTSNTNFILKWSFADYVNVINYFTEY